RVQAPENTQGNYKLSAAFEAGDVEKNSGEDQTCDGAGEISLKPKAGSANLVGSAKDEVSYDKQDRNDCWKVTLPDKGKLSVVFTPKDEPPKIRAEWLKQQEQDEGDRIKSGFNVDVAKQAYFI